MNLLEEIKGIEKEMQNTKSFQKLSELLSDMKKKCKENKAELDDEVDVYIPVCYSCIISNFRNFSQTWKSKKNEVSKETLENGEKLIIKVLLSDLEKAEEGNFPAKIFGENYLSDSKDNLNKLKSEIEKEKTRRQKSPNKPNKNKDNNSQLDEQIKKLEDELKEKNTTTDNFPYKKTIIIAGSIGVGIIFILVVIFLIKKIIKN